MNSKTKLLISSVWAYPSDIIVFKSDDQFDVKKKKRNLTKALNELKTYINKSNNTPTPPPPQQQEEEEKPPTSVSKRSSTRRRPVTTPEIPPTITPTKPLKKSKPSSSSSARINRPRLGEIPELENKRVSCSLKSGRIQGNLIRCDCCQIEYTVGNFEEHAGRAAGKKNYFFSD